MNCRKPDGPTRRAKHAEWFGVRLCFFASHAAVAALVLLLLLLRLRLRLLLYVLMFLTKAECRVWCTTRSMLDGKALMHVFATCCGGGGGSGVYFVPAVVAAPHAPHGGELRGVEEGEPRAQ